MWTEAGPAGGVSVRRRSDQIHQVCDHNNNNQHQDFLWFYFQNKMSFFFLVSVDPES